MRKPFFFSYAKTKTQISCTVTAQLIRAFVFAIRIVQCLYYLNPKFQASSHLMQLYSLVCVRAGRKPQRPVFSQRGSYKLKSRCMTKQTGWALRLAKILNSQDIRPHRPEISLFARGKLGPLAIHQAQS